MQQLFEYRYMYDFILSLCGSKKLCCHNIWRERGNINSGIVLVNFKLSNMFSNLKDSNLTQSVHSVCKAQKQQRFLNKLRPILAHYKIPIHNNICIFMWPFSLVIHILHATKYLKYHPWQLFK